MSVQIIDIATFSVADVVGCLLVGWLVDGMYSDQMVVGWIEFLLRTAVVPKVR